LLYRSNSKFKFFTTIGIKFKIGIAGCITNATLNRHIHQTMTNIVNFDPATTIFEAGEYFVAAADLNKDGKIDLVTKGLANNTLSVLTGNGYGSFNSTGIISNIGVDPFDARLADFNSDGNLDLLLENGSDPSVALGDGAGGFGNATILELPTGIFGLPNGSYVGDVNNDGKPDVISAIRRNNQISVLLNNGLGGFSTPIVTTVGINAANIAVGDVNGDGKLDLVTTNGNLGSSDDPDLSLVNNISVLLGNGTGGFSAPTNINVGSRTNRVVLGDFNGDTKLDIVVSTSAPTEVGGTNYSISALLNNGTGTFSSPTTFAVPGNGDIKVADLNGDSKLDLAITSKSSSRPGELAILTGNGFGSFSAPTILRVGRYPNSIAIGDFNLDTKPDLAVADFGDSNISVLLNQSIPPSTSNDFNGDGNSDILWQNFDGSIATWQMNGSTATPNSIGAVPVGWRIAGTGNFNSDTKTDILLSNANGTVATWELNGAIVSKTNTLSSTLTSGWRIAGTGDFTGDGNAEILLRNTDGRVATWQVNGSTVTNSSVIGTASADWTVAGTADFDSDGKVDILLSKADGTVALWQLDGAAIVKATTINVLPTNWSIAGTADFNGDGKADILLRNTDGSVAAWEMNGANITGSKSLGSAPVDWQISGTGDLNGDGKADVLWRNAISGNTATWVSGASGFSGGLTSLQANSTWAIQAPLRVVPDPVFEYVGALV
jgi:hypothetical protein